VADAGNDRIQQFIRYWSETILFRKSKFRHMKLITTYSSLICNFHIY
jgi:hypothetical protein